MTNNKKLLFTFNSRKTKKSGKICELYFEGHLVTINLTKKLRQYIEPLKTDTWFK